MAGTGRSKRPLEVRGSTLESSALLARMPDVSVWALELVGTTTLTPSMRRLHLRAPGLGALRFDPGQDLMVAVPAGDGRVFRRRYSIRAMDVETDTMALDVVLHGDGPGARWAGTAEPGGVVEAIGPRGKITLVPGATWHLFAGDESALPASFAMIEALPPGAQALCLLEVDGPADEQLPQVPAGCELSIVWLHRGDRAPGTSTVLEEAVESLDLPTGAGHAYLAGELRAVAGLRRVLVSRGLAAEQVSSKPYWRLGVSNAAQGRATD
jgi:NADPH-dependent ferric siderophore reductase